MAILPRNFIVCFAILCINQKKTLKKHKCTWCTTCSHKISTYQKFLKHKLKCSSQPKPHPTNTASDGGDKPKQAHKRLSIPVTSKHSDGAGQAHKFLTTPPQQSTSKTVQSRTKSLPIKEQTIHSTYNTSDCAAKPDQADKRLKTKPSLQTTLKTVSSGKTKLSPTQKQSFPITSNKAAHMHKCSTNRPVPSSSKTVSGETRQSFLYILKNHLFSQQINRQILVVKTTTL